MEFKIQEYTNFDKTKYIPSLTNADTIYVFHGIGTNNVSSIIEENEEISVYKTYYGNECRATWCKHPKYSGDWFYLNKNKKVRNK